MGTVGLGGTVGREGTGGVGGVWAASGVARQAASRANIRVER
jgi:hypothetical protein